MCLPYYSERRSRKSWEFVAPSSQQYSGLVLAIKKFLRYKEKRHLYALINPFFIFFWN